MSGCLFLNSKRQWRHWLLHPHNIREKFQVQQSTREIGGRGQNKDGEHSHEDQPRVFRRENSKIIKSKTTLSLSNFYCDQITTYSATVLAKTVKHFFGISTRPYWSKMLSLGTMIRF